ncbi:hypothetical protein HUG17_0863 [Dermatophagoides farinae]|uniref:Uncharacterized protein n=1 Tax=Dermatophagoides farinae TaxID=6954 RepID=A0A9D4SLC1_DERFA|nr:hypothetical protein HUG17_0863 [Dermatophagoides farinae]
MMYLDSERFPLYPLLGLLGIRTFYFANIDTLTFPLLYDCIVYNTDQYHNNQDTEENIRKKYQTRLIRYRKRFRLNHRHDHHHSVLTKWLKNYLFEKLLAIRLWIQSWLEMDRMDHRKFQQNPMKLFPLVTLRTRIRMLLTTFIMDHINFLLHLCLFIGYPIGWLIISMEVFSYDIVRTSFIMTFALIIESITLFIMILILMQGALLLSSTAAIPYQMSLDTLTNYNETLNKINRSRIMIDRKQLQKLWFVYRQHIQMTYYIIYADKDVWSHALYYYSLFSIPMNAMIICEILFEYLPSLTRILFIAIAIVHAATGSIPFLMLANVTVNVHAIKKSIPSIQLKLSMNQSGKQRQQNLRLKIKLDDLYERLTMGKKLSYTFGSLGDVTFRGLFEALLVYVGVFFMITGFYLKL